jgi:GTP pyrophosphokinase
MLATTDVPMTREVESLTELLRLMRPRCSDKELDTIRRAYRTAEEAHKDQKRSSGLPYIQHPLAVAGILAQMKLDAPTIAAALMHDVVEDTVVTIKDIEASFTPEIAGLIDAVTKLSKREGIKQEFTNNGHANGTNGVATNGAKPLDNKPTDPTKTQSTVSTYKTDREAESLRKMLLGLANDTRVVLIKLADRLHNMRTLDALKPEKQRRIARETLDIFAPLANRLGIWEWKQELEDLGFRYAEAQTYSYLQRILEVGASERDAQVKVCIAQLSREMHTNSIHRFEITGRAKQLYSLWRKMQRKGTSIDLIRDAQAIRVIIDDDDFIAQEEAAIKQQAHTDEDDDDMPLDELVSRLNEEVALERGQKANAKKKDDVIRDQDRRNPAVQDCYRVLGIVHSMWTPIPGEFDDYISVPKDNQYRSLHTAVITDDGTTLEVQIRSRSMHKAAEFGIAAHWLYKDQGDLSADYMKQIEVLRNAIKALGNDSDDAASFMDAMKADHFKDNIYCFTPLGKLIELPNGATALDFAYHVHTEVGHKCRGAKIDGAMVPLTTKLATGQQVEIITRSNATPSRDWIHDPEYLYTASAKSKVKAWFRKQERTSNIASGREIIERELRRLSVDGWLKVDNIFEFYKNETDDVDDFLEKVGYGHITTGSISGRILEEERRREQAKNTGNPLLNLIRPRTVQNKKGGWVVAGARGVLVAQASCCNPQPGDGVIGYVSITGGVKIHKRDCDNLKGMESDRMIDVTYEGTVETYPVQFEVTAAERTGLLAELTAILSHEHINILGCNIDHRDAASGLVYIYLNGELPKPDLITGIISRLSKVKHVFEVKRVIGNGNGRRR